MQVYIAAIIAIFFAFTHYFYEHVAEKEIMLCIELCNKYPATTKLTEKLNSGMTVIFIKSFDGKVYWYQDKEKILCTGYLYNCKYKYDKDNGE